MSWFIRSHKKSKRPKASKAKRDWKKKQAEYDPQRTWRILRTTGMMVLAVGLIVGAVFAQRWLAGQVAGDRAALPEVVLIDAPAWMRPNTTEQIRQTVAATVNPNPLDQQSLAAATEALGRIAWIEQVQRVTRSYDGRIEVLAVYRSPVAVVEARDGYHLIDVAAVKLPDVYTAGQLDDLHLPVIAGVRHAPPAEGYAWSGEDVRAGLKLAMLLSGEPMIRQVKAIDVSNHAARRSNAEPQIKLLTRRDGDDDPTNNPGVAWGRAPGAEGVYEPPAAQKVLMLRRVLRQHGSIDAGGQIVSVLSDTPMFRPLPTLRYTAMP
jgi:hypothetical protein